MDIPAAVAARAKVRATAASGRTYPRLLAWEGAEYEVGSSEIALEERRTRAFSHQVEVFERAQSVGQLSPDVDARVLALLFVLMGVAPDTLPQITRMITGCDPEDPDFQESLAETLRFVAERVVDTR
jgi:TetR/AcrR family transcriptional regulator